MGVSILCSFAAFLKTGNKSCTRTTDNNNNNNNNNNWNINTTTTTTTTTTTSNNIFPNVDFYVKNICILTLHSNFVS